MVILKPAHQSNRSMIILGINAYHADAAAVVMDGKLITAAAERCQSFWLDFKLILISFYITFRGRWEHRRKKF